MALYTKIEFAKLCGCKPSDINIYVSRKKIIMVDDLIDESNPVNILFIQKRQKKLKQEPQKQQESEQKPPPKNEKPPESSQVNTIISEIERTFLPYNELERQKKLADLIKVETDTRLAKLREEKLMGISIPTSLVKDTITTLSKSIISSFKDGADNFLVEIAKRKALSNTEIAECRGLLVEIINSSVVKAVNNSRKEVSNIVKMYSDKKEVGEHD